MNILNFSCFRNVSKDSITGVGWLVNFPNNTDEVDLTANGYAVAATVSVYFLTGVPWNLFVICTIIRKKLYRNPTILLLLNLAITNLLLGLLVMPFNIISGFSGEYIFGSSDAVRCHVCQTGVVLIVLPWVSIYTTSLMSVDRFIYLKRPLKYGVIFTAKRMLLAIIIIWILCTIIALPPIFGFGEVKFSSDVACCAPFVVGETHIAPNYYYVMFLAAVAIIPLIVLLTLYAWIVYIIRKSIITRFRRSLLLNRADEAESGKMTQIQRDRKKAQLRLVTLFGSIFTANLITWLPMIALALAGAIFGADHIHTLMYTLAYLAFLSETVIHPILEASLIREVRMILSGYLVCCKFKIKCRKRRKIVTKNNISNVSVRSSAVSDNPSDSNPTDMLRLSDIHIEINPDTNADLTIRSDSSSTISIETTLQAICPECKDMSH